jgi:hypothetical protein
LTTAGAVAAGERGEGGTPPARAEPLGTIVFGLLVAACFAAFFLTQRLKHTPTAVQRFQLTTSFSPVPSGKLKQERISFKLARADEVTVSIIDTKGDVVATLVRDFPVPRYKQFSLRWNGHRGTARRHRLVRSPGGHVSLLAENRGRLAPAGEYRVQVSLHKQARTVRSPRSFALVLP